jgi:hypothetical protein
MNDDIISIPISDFNIYMTKIDVDNSKIMEELDTGKRQVEPSYKDGFLSKTTVTYFEDERLPLDAYECEKLKKLMTEKVSIAAGKPMVLAEIWSLTLNRGQSITVHTHKSNTHMRPEEYYSVSYYVNAPEGSARLIFNVSICNTIERLIPITPEPGMFLIFNSFIQHYSDRHSSDEPRLVISANFHPENPDLTPIPDWSAYN